MPAPSAATGAVSEIHCTYDPQTRSGEAPDGHKVKSTIHWVSAGHAVPAEVRLYDQLFTVDQPDVGEGIDGIINPNSMTVLAACQLEPSLAEAKPGEKFQFERNGYFCADPDGTPGKPVFNRTVTLRDTWAKIQKRSQKKK